MAEITHLERPEAKADIATGDVEKYGHWFWDELNEVLDKMPCETCKTEGKAALQMFRDGIAISKGKAPYDPENFKRAIAQFDKGLQRCHELGFCSPRHLSTKMERCVRQVKAKGTAVNPYAVCRAAVHMLAEHERPDIIGAHDKFKLEDGKATHFIQTKCGTIPVFEPKHVWVDVSPRFEGFSHERQIVISPQHKVSLDKILKHEVKHVCA